MVENFTRQYGDGPAGNSPAALNIADIDSNGLVDLIVANRDDQTLSLFLSNGDGTFATRRDFAVEGQPDQFDVADINGDLRLDLVARTTSGSIQLLFGNGDGTFATAMLIPTDGSAESFDVADVNGDGRPDLILGRPSVSLRVASVSL